MDRREFLKDVAWGAAAIPAAAAEGPRKWTLENRYLSWEIEAGPGGIRSTGFHNKISGRRTALDPKPEFALVFSAAKHRIEIPWWEFSPGDDEASGHWTKVQNLAGSGGGRVYDGYGRFRAEVRLPEEASGEEIVLVLGGYDQQDWNERWVYVNGVEIGHDRSQGRWRSPGQYTIRPGDAAYGKLQFGTGTNLVAVRGHGYDLHFEGISDKALERYVFRAYLFDQFVSAGSPYLRIEDFALHEA
ncbi:MAG: hypothetical protein M1436_02280, partial [Acidobacteria bacterium]|nr:hypothetical protein [Acidobacteriota bacterium]